MNDQTQPQKDEEPVRTGGERVLQDELKNDDQQFEQPVNDNPGGNRDQRRRANFIDHNADEDGDPNTTEKTYRDQQQ